MDEPLPVDLAEADAVRRQRRPARALASGLILATAALAASAKVGDRPPPRRQPAPIVALATSSAPVDDDRPLPVRFVDPAQLAPPARESRVIEGPMEDVLYGRAGLDTETIGRALDLLGHKLDLTRDIALGDHIRLLARRAADGWTFDYVEWRGAGGAVRLYRRTPGEGVSADAFADSDGSDLRRLLLHTPLAHPRITSDFGLRRHPLLGFTRRHEGVDFAAPVGAAVLAAADGEVAAAGWGRGYGRLIRLDHGGGLQTLYGHLSAWAVAPGARVRQGQVIGWSGDSGLASGPHLHFEVRQDGRPIDPKLAKLAAPPADPLRQAAFDTRKQAIDAMLVQSAATG